MERLGFQRTVVLALTLGISLVFLTMLKPFLMTLLLAGISAAMAQPLYGRMRRLVRGRVRLASALTVALLVVVVLLPLLGVLGVVANQALQVSRSVIPWVEEQLDDPGALVESIQATPLGQKLAPYREPLVAKAGQVVGAVSGFLFDSLSATTRGTVALIFQVGLLLYALFYFLSDGRALLDRMLYYLPLQPDDEERMLERFTSVTRATVKGTLLIGVAQGALAGLAFAVAGLQGAVFWGTIMALLSIVPGIGTGLVWVPAAVILISSGRVGAGAGLAAWCLVVVGSIDNLVRPRLVGRDTSMHDLMILFSTLGGVMVFGALGFLIGPIVAALFVTVWEIYGVAFADLLPALRPRAPEPREPEPQEPEPREPEDADGV